MRARLPESPRWLESVGRLDEADASSSRMEREAERARPARHRRIAGPRSPSRPSAAASRVIFGAAVPRPHADAVRVPVFQTVGYYGFGTLVPTVLASKGYSIVTSLTFTSLTFIGYPVGSALSLPIIERVDRRWLIVGSAFLMSVFGLALGFASSPASIVAMGFLYTVASNIFSNALHIFQVEIFPTFARATAAGTAYGMSRLSSGAMPFVLLPVLDRLGRRARCSR